MVKITIVIQDLLTWVSDFIFLFVSAYWCQRNSALFSTGSFKMAPGFVIRNLLVSKHAVCRKCYLLVKNDIRKMIIEINTIIVVMLFVGVCLEDAEEEVGEGVIFVNLSYT